MSNQLALYKQDLNLDTHASKFFDFAVSYLGLDNVHSAKLFKESLDPWFGPSSDRPSKVNTVFSAYVDGLVHQKYRIALEFCAMQAGLEAVGYMESDGGMRPVSMNRFWFAGTHPNPVRWLMQGAFPRENEILARGSEPQGSLNLDTVERWLDEKIKLFKSLK